MPKMAPTYVHDTSFKSIFYNMLYYIYEIAPFSYSYL